MHGVMSDYRANYEASKELAGMCAEHRMLPNGPQVTVILRSLRDCIGASKQLGVRSSRLMYLLEELANDTPCAVAAAVPVRPVYRR